MARYRDLETGEILTEEQFDILPILDFSETQEQIQTQVQKPPSFLQRLKLSFGGRQQIEELKQREQQAGLRGRLDVGDIADIAGTLPSVVGATVGGIAGGPVGAGVGAAAGEAVRRFTGTALGVRPQETKTSAITGPAIAGVTTGIGSKAFQLGGRYLANRFPKLLGLFTGETEVVNAALRNPKAADLGIKQGDQALRVVVQEGGKRSIQLRDSFIKGQSQAINEVFKDMKVTKGFGAGQKRDSINRFLSMLKTNRVGINKDGTLNYSRSAVKANPGEVSKVNQAYEALQNWKNWSQRGVHDFKQLIGRLTRFPTEAGGTSKSPFLGRFYNFLNEEVTKGLPNKRTELYRIANKRFEDNIDLFDDLVDAFNSGDPFTRISQTFGKNKDSLRMLLDFYEQKTGVDIPAVQAGRELASERSAAFGFLNPREWIDLFIPPKIQARFVTTSGRAQELGKRIFPERLREGIRGGVSERGRRLFSGE